MSTEREVVLSGARSDLQILGVQSANATQIILGNGSSGSMIIDGIADFGNGVTRSDDHLEIVDRYTALAAENWRWGYEADIIINDTNAALRSKNLPELTENEIDALRQHSQEAFAIHTADSYLDNDFYYESVPFQVSIDGGRSYEFVVNSPESYNNALSALLNQANGWITLKFDAGDGYFLIQKYQRVDNGDGVRINVFESVISSDGTPAPQDVVSAILGSSRVWQFEMDGADVRALSAHDYCFGPDTVIDMWPCLTSAPVGLIWGFEQRRISGSSYRLGDRDDEEA